MCKKKVNELFTLEKIFNKLANEISSVAKFIKAYNSENMIL